MILAFALLAVAAVLTFTAVVWPLPPECTPQDRPNPALKTAAKTPHDIARAGAWSAGLSFICCIAGILWGRGKRWWFVVIGTAAAAVFLYATIAVAFIAFPCHGLS